MINAYERLGIPIDASEDVIKKAIARLAGQNKISINEAESYQKWLLDPAIRKQYNAKLFAEHPELIQQMVEEKVRSAKEDNEIENHLNNIDIIDEPKTAHEAQREIPSNNLTKDKRDSLSPLEITIYAVLIVGIIGILATCTGSSKEEKQAAETETGMQTLARMGVKTVLKDPGSAQFRNQKGLCGEVNAKNSFGAYSGYTRFIALGKDTAILEDGNTMEPGEFANAWQTICIENKGYP